MSVVVPVPVEPAKPCRWLGGLLITVVLLIAVAIAIIMTHPRMPSPWLGGSGVSIRGCPVAGHDDHWIGAQLAPLSWEEVS
jgi:hypothetical protein